MTPAGAARWLKAWVADRGEPAYRAQQAAHWLWNNPAAGWADATNLPHGLIDGLNQAAPILRLDRATQQTSLDGTIKFLWRLHDGHAIESVWIPEGRRHTLCISSQAGCAFGCVFCATGRMGFQRHLEAWEMTAQVREMLLDPELGRPNNVVFMGMGEPLHNWKNVDDALTTLNDPDGLDIGARRITVSTVGVIPKLRALAARPEQFGLAVSLHAATSEQRAAIMPIERRYPLHMLLDELKSFTRRITFEYVMIKDVNDSLADARALATIAKPLRAHVNLLSLHPGGASDLKASSAAAVTRFAKVLRAMGTKTTVRRSRGLDISAACGQLRVETEESAASKPSKTVTSTRR